MDLKLNLIDHSKKIVLITGTSGQIGEELCRQYLANGAFVIGIDIEQGLANESKNYQFFNVDIRSEKAVQECFQQISNNFGPVHILINNAGSATFEHYSQRKELDIDLMMDVNLKGTFNCIRAFTLTTDNTVKNRSIVNMGSIYGVVSPDFRIYELGDRRSSEIYGATKAGVIQLSRYFAVDLAPKGIRVNSISPGGVFNPKKPQGDDFIKKYSIRTPLNRMANASEIANASLFLTSDAATYITGHNLIVDGGYSAL